MVLWRMTLIHDDFFKVPSLRVFYVFFIITRSALKYSFSFVLNVFRLLEFYISSPSYSTTDPELKKFLYTSRLDQVGIMILGFDVERVCLSWFTPTSLNQVEGSTCSILYFKRYRTDNFYLLM